MKFDKNTEKQDSALDALLLRAQAPAPRTNFAQNVWRQIRCAAPTPAASTSWGIPWLAQMAAFSFSACLIVGALFLGQHLGHTQRIEQTNAQLTMLQPQTLAGIYLTTHAGR